MDIIKWIAISLLAFLTACGTVKEPAPSRVFAGEYIVESQIAAEWCQGEGADPTEECQEEVGNRTYLVTPLGEYSLIRTEVVGIRSEKVSVPYNRVHDLCYSQFAGMDCSPQYEVQATTDPLQPQQWGLLDIEAPEAWKIANSSNEPVVVTDTGVDCEHEINCIGEYNAITGEKGPGAAFDDNGHGTHVASTIGSICGNGEGICGVGDSIPILACKFLGETGGGRLSDAIKCLQWARERKAKIVNASWGCAGCYSRPLLKEIEKSRDAGLLVFAAAAGNEGVNNDIYPHYPSSYKLNGFDPIISVAAIGEDQDKASFSNYGLESVDVYAPGDSILAAWPGGGYKSISGTSMATPHIAAASSLLIGMGHGDPRQSILQHVAPYPGEGEVSTTGKLSLLQSLESRPSLPPYSAKPCREKKLKTCRTACREEFDCKYAKERRCRVKCKKQWCPQGRK